MSTRLQCEDCGWIGIQEDCIKEYKYDPSEDDVELCLQCPKCSSENLIESSPQQGG